MNERIKELEKQCWNHQTWQLDTEKFAELIVRQCAVMCRWEHEAKAMLEHFGVEE